MINKHDARLEVFEKRKAISLDTVKILSKKIFENALNLNVLKNHKTLLLYSAFRNETDTELFFKYALNNNIPVAFPKVIGENMEFYIINSLCDLKKGYMGILEPVEGLPVFNSDEGVIIVPGVAFDRHKCRCGYGKGFFDKYLSKHDNLIKIGICFEFQLYNKLKNNEHDIPMDYIITENTII